MNTILFACMMVLHVLDDSDPVNSFTSQAGMVDIKGPRQMVFEARSARLANARLE